MKVEYSVREISRFIVTRYHDNGAGAAGCEQRGEYDNFETAYEVAYALARKEHEDLGYPIGDERIQYPKQIIRGGAPAVEGQRLGELSAACAGYAPAVQTL